MRKIYFWSILTLIIATFLPGGLLAQERTTMNGVGAVAQRETSTHVTADEARAVGLRFLNTKTGQTRGTGDLQMSTAFRTAQGDTAFYVFNTTNGFVMVAADRCATPILGYSDEGPFDASNVPVQMQSYLHGFVEQIAYGIGHPTAVDAATIQQWQQVRSTGELTASRANRTLGNAFSNTAMANNYMTKSVMMTTDSAGKMVRKEVSLSDLMNGNAEDIPIVMPTLPQNSRRSRSGETGVGPLITANWDQGCYYNALCPADSNGDCGHTPTGCVATAMGMIMRYWGYPAQGTGTHSYTPDGYPEQTVNFGATTYDWDNMPDQLDASSTQAQIDAVSTLLWHCGVAVDMVYGAYSSSALDGAIPQAFAGYFGYCNGAYFQSKGDDVEWLSQVKASLDRNRPLIYFATDVTGLGGHAFVCDGYDASEKLHFNWGWGGNGNGYFALDALNVNGFQFNNDVHALFGILPQSEFQLHYNIIEGGAEVTYEVSPDLGMPAYNNYPDTIVIPAQVTIDNVTYPVVAIGDSAFISCDELKTVLLPNSIVSIGKRAFDANFSLETINLPNSLEIIKESAFIGALSLSEISLPDSIKTLEPWCFAYTALTEITIPRSLTTVGDGLNAFGWIETVYWNADSCGTLYYDGSALDGGWSLWNTATNVIIGEHVKHIPALCFYSVKCDSITIPDSVISIGVGSFIYCERLRKVTMGNSIVTIGGSAFYENDSLVSITIPEQVRYIGTAAFGNCDGLTNVFFNATNCISAYYGFQWGTHLADVSIGGNVTNIPGGTFIGCAIESILIPESVINIGDEAFAYNNIHNVDMLPVSPPMIVCDGNASSFAHNADMIFNIPCESYDAYSNDESWSCYRDLLHGVPETEIQLNILPFDSLQGSIVFYKKCGSTAIFSAQANHGYRFDHWSNGHIQNPDTLMITYDTTIYAYFVKEQFRVDGGSTCYLWYSNFEQSERDSLWKFRNEEYVNKWYINDLDNTRALFVSNDGGLNNSYTNENAHSFVSAYSPLHLEAGEYLLSFDWRSGGNSLGEDSFNGDMMASDCLFTFLYRGETDSITHLYEGGESWGYDWYGSMIENTLYAERFFGSNEWIRNFSNISIPTTDDYNLLYYWRNGRTSDWGEEQEPNSYPGAIDNIVFYQLDSIRGYFTGVETVDYLDTVTLTAVPNNGYHFVSWYDGDTNITKQVVATDNLTVAALFDYNQCQVTVNVADTTMGTVSGGGTYNYLSECTVTAIPAEGLNFIRWSDGNKANPRTITVTQDTTLFAIFGTCTDTLVVKTVSTCDNYIWNDSVYTQSGDYTLSFVKPDGCDSVVTLHLTVFNPQHTAVTAESCGSYEWNGETYTESGDYTYEHLDANGCTQVDTLHLTILNPAHTAVTAESCGSYEWNGETYTESGDYTYEHLDANGCTQVDTLHLTVFNPQHTAVTAESCGSYEWNGQSYTESGDYTYEHLDANGCTQVDTLHLTINQAVSSEFAVETADSCYSWNGHLYCESGDYTQTLTAASGCDSVVTLHLTITVGIDDHEIAGSMTVYPNPTTGVVNVQWTINGGQWPDGEIQVVDMYGRLLDMVETQSFTSLQPVQFDLSRYASGIYFVRSVVDGNVMAVRKVVKQ